MKFGGTSLRDAAAVRHVATLIADRLGQRPIVVVSAHGGVTDALVRIATEAVDGSPDIDGLEELHAGITADLGIEVEDHSDLFGELRDLCQGITLVSELSRRSKDYVVSFGERLSARTLAATLRATGTDARAFDAFDIGVHSDSLLELLNDIDRPNCKLGFDAWSPALRGEDIHKAAIKMAPYAAITTNADYVRLPRFQYQPDLVNYMQASPDMVRAVPFGDGFIDYTGFFAGLREGGFDGVATYEMCSPIRGGGAMENLDKYASRYVEWMKAQEV